MSLLHPFSMPKLLLTGPFYPFTFIFIAYTGYITIFMFGGCDAFYFEFCVNIGTLFKSLQTDLVALFEPFMGKRSTIAFSLTFSTLPQTVLSK